MMMADNVAITAGSGTNIATDDIGGVQYQRVKATWGVDGTATDVSAANPLPVVQTGALPAGTNSIGGVTLNSYVPPAAVLHNQVSLPTANTRVALAATSTPCRGVTIKNPLAGGNTDSIWIGSITVTVGNGYELAAGESLFLDIDNLNKIYAVAAVNSKSVQYATTV